MNKVIVIQKWINYILIGFGICCFLYTVTISHTPFGVLFPAYFLILAFINLLLLTFVNRISNNVQSNVFKDWKLFFVMLMVYFLIVLVIAVAKR